MSNRNFQIWQSDSASRIVRMAGRNADGLAPAHSQASGFRCGLYEIRRINV